MITTLGFGGNIRGLNLTSHCFAVNGNIFQPEIFKIEGVAEAYKQSLSKISLSGPTKFSEIINFAADQAQDCMNRIFE